MQSIEYSVDAEVSCDTERKKCSFAHLATFAVELVWHFSTAVPPHDAEVKVKVKVESTLRTPRTPRTPRTLRFISLRFTLDPEQ